MTLARVPVTALLRAAHFAPTVAVTAVTGVLGIAAGLEPWRLALVIAAVFCNQLSVGWSNDWIDADRDRAVGRTDKPVATGAVSKSLVRTSAFTAASFALVLTVPLGWPAVLAQVVFLGSAWAYNLGLKSTLFSVVPYIVGFAALPSLPTLAAAHPEFASIWLTMLGGVFGAAAHFANVAPDIDDDRATGVRGLPQRLMKNAHASRVPFRVILVSAVIAAMVVAFVS